MVIWLHINEHNLERMNALFKFVYCASSNCVKLPFHYYQILDYFAILSY